MDKYINFIHLLSVSSYITHTHFNRQIQYSSLLTRCCSPCALSLTCSVIHIPLPTTFFSISYSPFHPNLPKINHTLIEQIHKDRTHIRESKLVHPIMYILTLKYQWRNCSCFWKDIHLRKNIPMFMAKYFVMDKYFLTYTVCCMPNCDNKPGNLCSW